MLPLLKIFIVLVICVVNIKSDYIRVKRGKYFPGPPQRFYSRPPINHPIQGIFSYTPPPFMEDDAPYPGRRPYKVSKRPTNDGLGNEDIINIMKHLTKQDLNKLVEFASEKTKEDPDNDNYKQLYKQKNVNNNVYKGYIDSKYNYVNNKIGNQKYKQYLNEDVKQKIVYKPQVDSQYLEETPSPEDDFKEMMQYLNFVTQPTPTDIEFNGKQESQGPWPPSSFPGAVGPSINIQNNVQTSQTYSNPPNNIESLAKVYDYSQPIPQNSDTNIGIATESYEEEKLPLPDNMRTEDFEISYTNNVPKVVKASSYQVENFGDLPLMDYNSKLETVNSYSVPHYTVTTQSKPVPSYSSSSSSSQLKPSPGSAHIYAPPVEPAPPASAAKEQSDAHLKAIKIWSSKSSGAAYTLHDDGTLTPERPFKPKYG